MSTTDDTYAACREALKRKGYQFGNPHGERFVPVEAVMGMAAGLAGAAARGFHKGGHALSAETAWAVWLACWGVVFGDAE